MLYLKLLFICYSIYLISQKVISKKTPCLLFNLILKGEGTSDLLQLNDENRQIHKIF